MILLLGVGPLGPGSGITATWALAPEKNLSFQREHKTKMILEDLQHRYELLKPRISMVRSYL